MEEKTSKFLLCQNPMFDSDVFILHTRYPDFMVKILKTNLENENLDYNNISISFKYDNEIIQLEIFRNYNNVNDEILSQHLKFVKKWYKAYLNGLKKNIYAK